MDKKLIIGTAQYIKKYGVFGKSQKKFNNFLEIFKNKNITFDTSPNYSSAESFIGRNFKKKKISSKLPSLKNIPDNTKVKGYPAKDIRKFIKENK